MINWVQYIIHRKRSAAAVPICKHVPVNPLKSDHRSDSMELDFEVEQILGCHGLQLLPPMRELIVTSRCLVSTVQE